MKHFQNKKGTVNRKPENKLTSEFKTESQQAHEEILSAAKDLRRRWVSLARRVQKFQEDKSHRAIIDQKTGKPFRRFEDWFGFVFGASKSQLYLRQSILKSCTGKVTDEDLDQMPLENAKNLAKISDAGVDITDEVVKDAKSMAIRDHRKKTAKLLGVKYPKVKLGPYSVSAETAESFEAAIETAGSALDRKDDSDAILKEIAATYLAVKNVGSERTGFAHLAGAA
jgi:hypothetical protein